MSALLTPRKFATPQNITFLKSYLAGLDLEGQQAAELLDEMHDCLADSVYIQIGSVDLNDIAGKISKECEAFE